jgi:hypothetical protein
MANFDITFIHPTDRSKMEVSVPGTMTGNEIIEHLLDKDFMPRDSQGYELMIKGGNQISLDQSLEKAGVSKGDTIRVVPQTVGGIQ